MTTAVLSPLRKQGDVSKDPTAPIAVLLQGSSAPPTVTASHEQGTNTFPTATTTCTQGSGSSLLDTLAHCYTPIVHLGLLLTSIKGRSRALVRRGGRAGGRADARALSLSLANACNPLLQAHPPWAQDKHEPRFPLLFPLVFRLAPTHLGWDTQRQFTRRSRDPPPPGSKHRQLSRQVGVCCVLTNNFPSSFRRVVSSNLSSPGHCSVSGVSSSCPSTAATTWYSFLCRATTTTTTIRPPDDGGIDDVFPV
jgi:hypothetical protein